MIVNASYSPGDFYLDTIHHLCGNTTYEFASWIVNLNKPNSICGAGVIRPNITFSIEKLNGAVLASFTTGAIEPTNDPSWLQYGLFFTTQPNTRDVVIRMKNNAPGGCGNDLGLDDITFRPCGRNASAYIESMSGNRINICQNQATTVKLNAMISAGTEEDPVYQWQTSLDSGQTWQDVTNANSAACTINTTTNTTTGMHLYRLSIAESGNINTPSCRAASNIDTLVIYPTPAITISGTPPVCAGTALDIIATGTYPIQWRLPSQQTIAGSTIHIASATEKDAGKYYAIATSDKGCTYTDSGFIAVIYPIPIANAGENVNICKGSSTLLQGTGGTIYRWTPVTALSDSHISTPQASPAATTTYLLTVSNQFNCTDTASVTVSVQSLPTANAGEDKWVVYGQSVQLNGSITGTNSLFYWTPEIYLNNSHILTPRVSPEHDTTYTLYVSNNCGQASDEVFVKVYRQVEAPNIFSPNGDGIYDTWNIPALTGYPNAEVSVFSRYGMRVFYSKGYHTPWNGSYNNKKVPAGTYYYVIDLKDNSPRLSGSVTVL
ncbi:hypothetical protein FLA_0775 [Filimonas lacunae]|nr:hypothetical protein FLA_0775 [Filimonas lacunae]